MLMAITSVILVLSIWFNTYYVKTSTYRIKANHLPYRNEEVLRKLFLHNEGTGYSQAAYSLELFPGDLRLSS